MSGIKDSYYGDDLAPGYPATPGFSEPTTSKDSAAAMKTQAANLRALVLAALSSAGPVGLTADEIADKLNQSVLSIRPRVTELGPKHFNRIERTGARRRNISGQAAAVWRVKR